MFAAACMNSRTNGTIHFGIGDTPKFEHGQVLGVAVDDKEAYTRKLKQGIDKNFEHKHKDAAEKCIKPPRFVEVINRNATSSEKFVIEVDIKPQSDICGENFYHTYITKKDKKKNKETESQPSKFFYIRDGGSTRDLLAPSTSSKPMVEYNKFVAGMPELSKLRKDAEEKHSDRIKQTTQGTRITHIITGGTLLLDKSHFERYVIVTNKSHPSHLENLRFLTELEPTAVLDFDPESAEHGLLRYFDQLTTVSPHLPAKYKIMESVSETAVRLELPKNTSWVFCNGGIEHETPSDINQWFIDKGASVRDVISFLCRKDVLPNKRFLVIFLLLSTVRERMDPLVETFSMFLQELKDIGQILCICDNENAFTSWRDLIDARCGLNISGRCIYELSFAEVNGTILSLWSKNRRAIRFLPCGGETKVPLEKKLERSINTLEVLCVNQCEGGNEDRVAIEENFYKGGNVSWWNFYFSEQPGSTPFIKRDMFDYIVNTGIPELCSLTKACVLFNLLHVPGCGGTTLAMHVLWFLREKYRCAVLRNKSDFADVADQVIKLLTYSYDEQAPRIPVLLMIDDFDDMEKVYDLQQVIEKECTEKGIRSAKVILLNCMRPESSQVTEPAPNIVFIRNELSEKEKQLFEMKHKEIEEKHPNFETFYGFMIMKKNFREDYIKGVVQKTLKNFNMEQKNAQLFAVLVLLRVYSQDSSLSLSLCLDVLGYQIPVCGGINIDDAFGEFSSFVSFCWDEDKVKYRAVKITYSVIARQCLEELRNTHDVTKARITDFLLTTDELFEHTQGRDNLLYDVHNILVKRFHSFEGDSKFSPLIQQVAKETPGQEENVLANASKFFKNDAVIFQLLARYYYLKKKEFPVAKEWAKKAMELSKDSSYIADTSAQVIKHQLKNEMSDYKDGELISPEKLGICLKMAQSAMEAFQFTQSLAKKECLKRSHLKNNNSHFNTSGCLGDIQVGVSVIILLEKTPVFSLEAVRHDVMSEVLSGKVAIKNIKEKDPHKKKNRGYYDILQQFEKLLYDLKKRMKLNFDYLDKMHVNLGTIIGVKNIREQVAQKEISGCFEKYTKVFCKTESADLLKKMDFNLGLHQARQFLEKEKADTYSRILDCLTREISVEMIEEIAGKYNFICQPKHRPTTTEKINMIYANVVLGCIKAGSDVMPSQDVIRVLSELLDKTHKEDENLSLHFIAVVLLWPLPKVRVDVQLGRYISLLKTSYHDQMKEVYNGKRPIVHFLLGRKSNCKRLVHIKAIQSCITGAEEQFASLWGNGQIWKNHKVRDLLQRVTGQVTSKGIQAETSVWDLKLEVIPMFRSQIIGLQGSKVSFFIGFSMKGPLALDIEKL
ncbi:sterile alpha motif domain-containing protein 9-like isoform 1-T2 [Fundulus diaphanus]